MHRRRKRSTEIASAMSFGPIFGQILDPRQPGGVTARAAIMAKTQNPPSKHFTTPHKTMRPTQHQAVQPETPQQTTPTTPWRTRRNAPTTSYSGSPATRGKQTNATPLTTRTNSAPWQWQPSTPVLCFVQHAAAAATAFLKVVDTTDKGTSRTHPTHTPSKTTIAHYIS